MLIGPKITSLHQEIWQRACSTCMAPDSTNPTLHVCLLGADTNEHNCAVLVKLSLTQVYGPLKNLQNLGVLHPQAPTCLYP